MARPNSLVPGHAFDHAAKRRPVTANAPSFLVGKATDRLRSAPATFVDPDHGAVPMGNRHPAPGSYEPQKIVGALPRSKWAAEAGTGGGRAGPPSRSRRDRPPSPPGPRVHRSLARRPAGAVQPLDGSLAGASRSRTFLRGVLAGMPRCPIQARRRSANPFSRVAGVSPNRFRRRPDLPRSRCRRAECNSRPAPVCGRPS